MILTLADFKDYPEYDSSKTDAQVQIMLNRAESDYLNIRNTAWRELTVTLVNGSADITINSTEDTSGYIANNYGYDFGLQVGMPIYSADGGQYGKIQSISSNTLTSDTNSSTDADTTLYCYPLGSRDTVAMMVQYQFQKQGYVSGLKSESIFKHSWSRDAGGEMTGGYPKEIAGRIKRYAGISGGSVTGNTQTILVEEKFLD